jgi:four helix bundle protein
MQSMLDHEKLVVYQQQQELIFLTWVTEFMIDLSRITIASTREVRDQLDRASISILLNTAEANGRRRGQQRAKYFDDARGSALECGACLDVAVAKKFVPKGRIDEGKEMLVGIVSMLVKLVEYFDSCGGERVAPRANSVRRAQGR